MVRKSERCFGDSVGIGNKKICICLPHCWEALKVKFKASHGGIGGIADLILVCSNYLFGFLVIYFFIIVSAPLFGGITLPISSYIPFAYWAGFYVIVRYFLKSMRDKIRLKDYQYWFICLYFSAFVWDYPTPVNFIAFILWFVSFVKIIKKETNAWATNLDQCD